MLCHVHKPGWVMSSPLNCISSLIRFCIFLHLNTVIPNFPFVCEAGEVEEMEDTTVLAELG